MASIFVSAFALAGSLAFALAACHPGLSPKLDHWPDERPRTERVLGCAELGFSIAADSRIPPGSLLLDVGVRNRCVVPAPFDARGLRITGFDPSGAPHAVTIFDPRRELRATKIDSETEAIERIRLDPSDYAALRSVCIDVSRVSRDATRAAPQPVCLEVPE
jgi:hypothetical protein